ncbi:ferritin-like domain-containing protein [Chloroflexota bacterium]
MIMAESDRITEEGKKQIIALLNDSIRVEYGMILNYPRIIEKVTIIDKNPDKDFTSNMERLGKDSFRHSSVVTRLIEDLGGKPSWEAIVIDRMIDVHSMMVEQLAKEKLAMSIYKEAKMIARKHAAKDKGFLSKLLGGGSEDKVSRSEVIRILTALESDEASHMKRVEIALPQVKAKPE